MRDLKECNKCKKILPVTDFYLRKNKKGDRVPSSQCKGCVKSRAAEFRNSEKGKEYITNYSRSRSPKSRQAEREKIAERSNRRYETSSAQALRRYKVRQTKKEIQSIVDIGKKRREARLLIARPWLDKSLSEKERYRLRYRRDNEFQVKERVRNQIAKHRKHGRLATLMRLSLNRCGESPTITSVLGYTIKDLAKHLESQFSDGMTWGAFKRGEIHIDHIRPVSSFNLDSQRELKECWGLPNLQPLWAADNLRKGAQWDRQSQHSA